MIGQLSRNTIGRLEFAKVSLQTLLRRLKAPKETKLRRIPLNVRAISAKNIYQKTAHSTVTF